MIIKNQKNGGRINEWMYDNVYNCACVSFSINMHISFLFEMLAGMSGSMPVAVRMDLCQSSCNITSLSLMRKMSTRSLRATPQTKRSAFRKPLVVSTKEEHCLPEEIWRKRLTACRSNPIGKYDNIASRS